MHPDLPERSWRPDWLLRAILGWTALTFVLAWLPMIRCILDGASYSWQTTWWGMTVGGSGIGGAFVLLPVQVALGASLLWLGWRGARPPFHWLLLAWHAALCSSITAAAIIDPDAFRFRGDTAGIDISLTWVGPILTGGFLLAGIVWVVRDLRAGGRHVVAPWNRINTAWLCGLAALLPVQFVLLGTGAPHGTTDLVGVLLTIAQWMLLGHALKPRDVAPVATPAMS